MSTPASERLWIRITPGLKEQLQQLAEEDGRTVSNYVLHLVTQALAERAKKGSR